MIYILLVILFAAVFGLITWRIVMRQAAAAPQPDEAYVCPVCNERHCECHKKKDA